MNLDDYIAGAWGDGWYVEEDDAGLKIITARKITAYIPISNELVNPWLYPIEPVHYTRRERLRAWFARRIWRARYRIASRLAGFDVEAADW